MIWHGTPEWQHPRVFTMAATICLYDQVLSLLRQYSHPRNLRPLNNLGLEGDDRTCQIGPNGGAEPAYRAGR